MDDDEKALIREALDLYKRYVETVEASAKKGSKNQWLWLVVWIAVMGALVAAGWFGK